MLARRSLLLKSSNISIYIHVSIKYFLDFLIKFRQSNYYYNKNYLLLLIFSDVQINILEFIMTCTSFLTSSLFIETGENWLNKRFKFFVLCVIFFLFCLEIFFQPRNGITNSFFNLSFFRVTNDSS